MIATTCCSTSRLSRSSTGSTPTRASKIWYAVSACRNKALVCGNVVFLIHVIAIGVNAFKRLRGLVSGDFWHSFGQPRKLIHHPYFQYRMYLETILCKAPLIVHFVEEAHTLYFDQTA